MSFLDRFFNSGDDPISVFFPEEKGGAQWVKRFLMTAVAATAVATTAPWVSEKLEMVSVAQKMQSVTGADKESFLNDVSAAKDALDFYEKFLADGKGPGELRIEITSSGKSVLFSSTEAQSNLSNFESILDEVFHRSQITTAQQNSDEIFKSQGKDVMLPDICLLKISLADVQGLAELAKANPDQMDVRNTANGFGHDIYVAGEILASRTQCMLEAQAKDAKERLQMNDYINAASYAHATLLIGQQISAAAAHSFADTLGKIYGKNSPLTSGSSRAAKVFSTGTLGYTSSSKPLVTMGIAMKVARYKTDNVNETSIVNDDDYANMLRRVTQVASQGNYSNSEAVFQIEGHQLAWKSGSVARSPTFGALHARLIDEQSKQRQQAVERRLGGGGS